MSYLIGGNMHIYSAVYYLSFVDGTTERRITHVSLEKNLDRTKFAFYTSSSLTEQDLQWLKKQIEGGLEQETKSRLLSTTDPVWISNLQLISKWSL